MIERLKKWFRREPEPEIKRSDIERTASLLEPKREWRMEVTPDYVERFQKRHGGQATMALLGKLGRFQPYHNIMTSDLGQIILGDIFSNADRLLERIAANKADVNEKAEYRAYMRIAKSHTEKIAAYIKFANKLKGED